MRNADWGVEKADKIAFLTNYIKPLEIIGPGRYMGIKSKHFCWPKNRGFIAEIHAPKPRFLLSSATPIVGTKCEQLERQEICWLGDTLTSYRPFR